MGCHPDRPPTEGITDMAQSTSREHRVEVLLELARHANDCSCSLGDPALNVVTALCPAIQPVRRAQLWHTVRAQVAVLDAIEADRRKAVRDYLGSDTLVDAPRLIATVNADLDRALERLVHPHIDDRHQRGCACTACRIVRVAS